MRGIARACALLLVLGVVPATATMTLATGCAGQKARTHVLVPALQLASYGLEADAMQGVQTLPVEQQGAAQITIENFFEIIRGGDEDRIRRDAIVTWGRIQELVEAGIVDKLARDRISLEAAGLLRARSRDFDQQLRAFITRAPSLIN